jgi:hypothetical protein
MKENSHTPSVIVLLMAIDVVVVVYWTCSDF